MAVCRKDSFHHSEVPMIFLDLEKLQAKSQSSPLNKPLGYGALPDFLERRNFRFASPILLSRNQAEHSIKFCFFAMSYNKPMPFKLSEKQILWGMILLYIVVFGTITALRHYNFQTQTWDLAAFVQSIWNAGHGKGLVNTLEQVHNHLGLHFSPWLFVLVPGYVIFQTPYFLLFVQTLAIALGAWPLYLLAQRILNRPLLSYMIAAAYLLYPGLQWANMYDFHEITFFVPLFLTALYFLEVQKFGWGVLFLALSASVKEDAILAVLFAGVYLFFRKSGEAKWFNQNRKIGAIIAILAIIYFVLAVKIFMPALGGGVLRFDRYINLGETPAAVLKNVAANPLILIKTAITPEKIRYLFWLLLPVAFLPLLSWRSLILLIPGLAENLLTNYQFQFSGLYHYDSILIPGLFLGTVYGMKFFLDRWPGKENWLKWVFIGAIVIGFFFRSPLNPTSFPVQFFQSRPEWQAYRNMVKLVPPGVSVAAQTNLVPHLANRERIYLAGLEPALADIVLLDANDLFGFKEPAVFKKYIDNYMLSGQYNFNAFEDRYIVLLNKKFQLSSKAQQ